MTADLLRLFQRDLEKMTAELETFPGEASLWQVTGEFRNPAGTLALHVVGNLNHFVGAVLGHSGYQRDREAEFARRGVPRAELLEGLRDTGAMLERVLPALEAATLEQTYPLEVLGQPMSTHFFLLHLYGHLNWHLGQMNALRRMLPR